MVALNLVKPVQVFRVPEVHKLGHCQPNHEHLPNFFFERKLLQRFLRPLFTVMIKMDRFYALKVAGKRMRGENQQRNAGKHQLLRHLFYHWATITEMQRQFGENVAHQRLVSGKVPQPLTLQALPLAKRFHWVPRRHSSASLALSREHGQTRSAS